MNSILKYGVSTWWWKSPFTNADTEFYFQKIKSLGFDAVELPYIIECVEIALGIGAKSTTKR